jgi:hypothetical protein
MVISMNSLKVALGISLIGIGIRFEAKSQDRPHVLSVCEAIDARTKLNDQTTSITGILRSSYHGFWLIDQNAVSGSFTCQIGFASLAIDIEHEVDSNGDEVYSEKAIRLNERLERSLSEAELRRTSKRDVDVIVTVRGRLHGKEKFSLSRIGEQGLSGNGFGHMGVYAAELAVNEIILIHLRETVK